MIKDIQGDAGVIGQAGKDEKIPVWGFCLGCRVSCGFFILYSSKSSACPYQIQQKYI
jgi:hypothetical protein